MSSLSARLRRQPPTTSVLQYLSIFAMMATSRNKLNMFLALLVLGSFVADCFSFFLPSLRIDRIVQGSRDSYQPSLVTGLDSKLSSSRFPSRISILLAGRSSNNEVASKIDERSNGKGPSKNTKKIKKPAKDWYAILGATPSMNKYEIKKLYVQLAKETHPDSSSDGPTPESIEKFNDVAQAWSILSDPKSKRAYDRERAADKMRDDIVDYVSDAAREYGPQLGKFYDEFAIPLLKRTTASTLAGFRAVSGEVARGGSDRKGSGNKNGKQTSTLLEKEKEAMEEKFNESGKTTALSDFGRAFQKVIEAGQNATRQIDAEELKMKSIELRKEADEARKESLETLERLASIKSERLRLTFHTSSANFTSVEALQFLDGFNTLDEVTLMDRMTFKHTISHDIEAFSEAENEFNKKALEKKRMDLQVKSKGIEYERAVRNLKEAELAEARARKMLEDAIKNVAESQTKLADAQRAVTDITSASKRTDQELDKSYSILKRKRDIVRRALKRKEEKEGLPQNNKQVIVSVANNSTGEIANKTATAKKNGKSMAALGFEKQNVLAIEELRKEEARTESEFLRLVDRASRLVSRSERLRLRSEALIGQKTIIDESTSNLIQNTTSLEKTEVSKEIKNATKGMKDAEKTNLASSNVLAKSVERIESG